MHRLTTPEGTVLFVDRDDVRRGTDGPFYVAYRSDDRTERWGYVCGNCEGVDTAMDTMGRIVCNDCENHRKPTGWDAAHE